MRDARITPIYEGTNGIQALDLLGRKVFGTGGKSQQMMSGRIRESIDEIRRACRELAAFAADLGKRVDQWDRLTAELGKAATKNPDEIGAAASDYLQFSGYVCLGWCWLVAAGRRGEEARAGPGRSRLLQGQARHGAALLRAAAAARRRARGGRARRCGGTDGAVGRAVRDRMSNAPAARGGTAPARGRDASS